MSSKDHDLIIAEIHHAIKKLGGRRSLRRQTTPRALRDLGSDIDLLSIVDSWSTDTLPRVRTSAE
jgi:hypothetical protein